MLSSKETCLSLPLSDGDRDVAALLQVALVCDRAVEIEFYARQGRGVSEKGSECASCVYTLSRLKTFLSGFGGPSMAVR